MELDMVELAKKYIQDHRSSKIKLNLPASKFFLKVTSEEDREVIKKCQDNLEAVLKQDRVNKRNARTQAVWLPEKELALVTKVTKSLLKSFGYQDKTGVYLYPEEMLFLLETNKLEVSHKDAPISIEEAYDLFSKCEKCSFDKYRAFKKLALVGYKLLRHEEIQKRLNVQRKPPNKRSCEEVEENDTKKMKMDVVVQNREENIVNETNENNQGKIVNETNGNNREKIVNKTNENNREKIGESSSNAKTEKYIANIFQNLRKQSPKETVIEEVKKPPDYFVFLPANNHRTNYDFKLYICEKSIFTDKKFSDDQNIIYAMCLKDDVSFYKFSNLHLPCI